MATAGFLGQLGADAEATRQQVEKQRRDDAVALRERHADQIQQSIVTFQNDPELTDAERQFKISEAQKQLTGLYQPHEGQDLFNRLGRMIHRGDPDAPPIDAVGNPIAPNRKSNWPIPTSTSAVQTRTPAMSIGGVNIAPGPTTQVHPGMTIDEVLSAGSPAAAKRRASAAIRDKWQQITGKPIDDGTLEEIARKANGLPQEKIAATPAFLTELAGSTLSGEDKEKAMRVHFGLDAKASDKADKPMEADIKGSLFMGVNDPATGKKYSRTQLESGDAPKEALAIYQDYKTGKSEQAQEESRKEAFSLEKQSNAIAAALEKQDYTKAKTAINKGKDAYIDALTRSNTMDQNIKDAQNGSQQAMLSLVANHIGMTLGAQKGARITRAVWDEAMASAPWLDTVAAKWFHEDASGDKIFDGYKSGVNLTPEQMTQMVDLAHQRRDVLKKNIDTIQEMYGEDIATGEKLKAKAQGGKSAGKPKAAGGAGSAGEAAKAAVFILNGKTYIFPPDKQDVAARFRRKHPEAKETQEQ